MLQQWQCAVKDAPLRSRLYSAVSCLMRVRPASVAEGKVKEKLLLGYLAPSQSVSLIAPWDNVGWL